MGVGLAISGGLNLLSSLSSSGNDRAQAELAMRSAVINSEIDKIRAEQSLYVGQQNADRLKAKGRAFIGSQRAAAAANGINVDYGSSADVQSDTRNLTTQDALTIKSNAWLQSFGYRLQATNDILQGVKQNETLNNRADQSLISGGLKAINYLDKFGF